MIKLANGFPHHVPFRTRLIKDIHIANDSIMKGEASPPPRQSKVRLTPFPLKGENIRPLPCSSFSLKSQRLFGVPGSPNGESSDTDASAPPRRNKLSLLRLFYAKKSSAAPLFLLSPKKPKAFRGPLVHPIGVFVCPVNGIIGIAYFMRKQHFDKYRLAIWHL